MRIPFVLSLCLIAVTGCSWIVPYSGDWSSSRQHITPGQVMEQNQGEDAARALSNQARVMTR
jgi:hypothetical protein